MTVAFWTVLRGYIPPLFQTPSCGEGCLGQMVISTLQPLAVTAVIAFVVIGILDMPLQRHLFLKEMRMSLTEKKKEMKELEGNPLIKAERRRLQFMFATQRKCAKACAMPLSSSHTKIVSSESCTIAKMSRCR